MYQQIITQELEALKQRITNQLQARNVTGKTLGSLQVQPSESGATITASPALQTLFGGRAPGNVPKGFYQIILDWVNEKGISFSSEEEKKTFAYFVSKKIKEQGTQLYRAQEDYNIDLELSQTIDNISQKISQQLINELLNNLNTK